MIVLYLGPDSLLPLASILTAVLGFILLFWHRLVGLARKLFGRAPRSAKAAPPEDEKDKTG